MAAAPRRERRQEARPRSGAPKPGSRSRASRTAAAPSRSPLAAAGAFVFSPWMLIGLLSLIAVGVAGALVTGDSRVGQALDDGIQFVSDASRTVSGVAQDARALTDDHFAGLGLRVSNVRVEGASAQARDDILRAADLHVGAGILGVDPAAVRARVEAVGWVSRARVSRLLPDTVVISVVERPLTAVWQIGGVFHVVTADGTVAQSADPARFRFLPQVIGPDANIAAAEGLRTVRRHPFLAGHVRALRRVDQRRWDIILPDGGVVMLPADAPDAALTRLERLQARSRILDLGLERIDLRVAALTVIRPRAAADPAKHA